MDAMNMHQFQNSGTSGGALARPPGLEAPAAPRKVSFAADYEACPKPRLAGGGIAASQQKVQSQPLMQSTGKEPIDLKFCVHCGTKVAEKLLKMKNVKFCVNCGKQHPENFMDVAGKVVKVETPNEEFADLIALKQKVETIKTVDMLAQLISMCDAQLTPAMDHGQFAQQQIPWKGKVFGEQCRQSANPYVQHGGFQQQYAGHPAYAYAGHSA